MRRELVVVILVGVFVLPPIAMGAPEIEALSTKVYCNLGDSRAFLVRVYNPVAEQRTVTVKLSSPGPVAYWSCVGCPLGKIGTVERDYVLDPLEEAMVPVSISCLGVGMYPLTVEACDGGCSQDQVEVNVLHGPDVSGFSRAPGMAGATILALASVVFFYAYRKS